MSCSRFRLASCHFKEVHLAGIGERDGEIIRGSALGVVVRPIAPNRGSANRDEMSGITGALPTEVTVEGNLLPELIVSEGNSGIAAIDEAGGRPPPDVSDPAATAELSEVPWTLLVNSFK